MNNSYIAVFDSGVGGLNILESLIKAFPNENFIYLADEEFFPYGVKTKEQLEDRLTKITKKLVEFDIKAIIIACNTASANSKHLNKITDIPIIEIITSTANYALEQSPLKKIGVWATNATIKSGCYQEIINNGGKCYPVSASDFVELIENNQMNTKECIDLVKKHLNEIKDADCLILGCTHFPLLRHIVTEFNKDLIQISSNKPVEYALKTLLGNDLLHKENNNQIIDLYTTKKDGELGEKAKRFEVSPASVNYLEIK
jgi:glutamate racemase